MAKFAVGDRVRVSDASRQFGGKSGFVMDVVGDGAWVKIDGDNRYWYPYCDDELTVVADSVVVDAALPITVIEGVVDANGSHHYCSYHIGDVDMVEQSRSLVGKRVRVTIEVLAECEGSPESDGEPA